MDTITARVATRWVKSRRLLPNFTEEEKKALKALHFESMKWAKQIDPLAKTVSKLIRNASDNPEDAGVSGTPKEALQSLHKTMDRVRQEVLQVQYEARVLYDVLY